MIVVHIVDAYGHAQVDAVVDVAAEVEVVVGHIAPVTAVHCVAVGLVVAPGIIRIGIIEQVLRIESIQLVALYVGTVEVRVESVSIEPSSLSLQVGLLVLRCVVQTVGR